MRISYFTWNLWLLDKSFKYPKTRLELLILKTRGFTVDTNELNRSNIQATYMKFQLKIHFDMET